MAKAKYTDPKVLQAKIDEYFELCAQETEKVVLNNKRDSITKLKMPNKVPLLGELAVHLDIDPNTWRRWEDGEVKFGDEKVAKTMRSILARTRARLISAIVDAGTCGRLPERLTLALLAQHGVSMNPEELGGGGFTVQIVNYGELSIGEDKLAQVRSQLSLPNGGKPELNEA